MRIDHHGAPARAGAWATGRRVSTAFFAVIAGAGIGAALAGCSDTPSKQSATLDPGAFKSDDPGATTPPPSSSSAAANVKTITQHEAAAGYLDLTSLPGAPSTLSPTVTTVGEEIVIDQFIGQINGRAVMASEFFGEGFGDRLRANGKDERYVKRPDAWVWDTRRDIHQRLTTKINDGLVLDEVYSAMAPEAKQGIRYMVEAFKNRLVAGNEGSEARTDERYRQETGMTLDEFVADARDRGLMQDHLWSRVNSRVNVSWQQVKDEHERLMQEALANRMVRFTVVWITSTNTENVQAVKDLLARGVPFGEIAESELNEFGKPGDRSQQVKLKGDLAHTDVFGPKPLNDAAKSLSPGQTTEPIVFREKVCWIHYDGEIMADVKSLYDAQLQIIDRMKASLSAKKTIEYYGQLKEKSSLTNVSKMEEKLLMIAIGRYGPPDAHMEAPAPAAVPTLGTAP